MSAFTGKRTGSPDNVNGHLLATIPSKENATVFIPIVVRGVGTLDSKPSAHRTALTSADSTVDLSSSGFGTSLYSVNNDAHLVVWGESNASSGAISFIPIWYDGSSVPMFEDMQYTIQMKARRVSSSGNFVSNSVCISTLGAPKVKLYVAAITGHFDLYVSSF